MKHAMRLIREDMLALALGGRPASDPTPPGRVLPRGLPESIAASVRLPWPVFTVALFALMSGLVFLGFSLDGTLGRITPGDVRVVFFGPGVTLFVMIALPALGWLRDGGLLAMQAVTAVPEEQFDREVASRSGMSARWEFAAAVIAVGVAYLIFQPWKGGWPIFDSWIGIILFSNNHVMYGAVGVLVYRGLANSWMFTRLQSLPVELDPLNPQKLQPIGRWSLANSMSLLGTITVMIAFLPLNDLRSPSIITLYSVLGVCSAAAFFLGLAKTHSVMAAAKEREVSKARQAIASAYDSLKVKTAAKDLSGIEDMSYSLQMWQSLLRELEAAPAWPYDTAILKRLLFSALAPAGAALAKLLPTLPAFK